MDPLTILAIIVAIAASTAVAIHASRLFRSRRKVLVDPLPTAGEYKYEVVTVHSSDPEGASPAITPLSAQLDAEIAAATERLGDSLANSVYDVYSSRPCSEDYRYVGQTSIKKKPSKAKAKKKPAKKKPSPKKKLKKRVQ